MSDTLEEQNKPEGSIGTLMANLYRSIPLTADETADLEAQTKDLLSEEPW